MSTRIYPVLEHTIGGPTESEKSGIALARIIEAHPALVPLLDFYSADPMEIAVAVGMVSPHEEDGEDDLNEIDFGPEEWFEPSAGLTAVRQALDTLRNDPQSIQRVLYAPDLHPKDVIADLEAIEQALQMALQHETRFHFALDT